MTEEELARKKNVRGANRAGVTRLINQAAELLAAVPLEGDELTLLKTNMSSKSKTLDTLNAEIVELTQ